MALTSFKARKAVYKGAAFLDNHRPGWMGEITLSTLDQADGDNCVLGQLYGHYAKGTYNYQQYEGFDAVEMGFNSGHPRWTENNRLLTDEWKAYIREARDGVTHWTEVPVNDEPTFTLSQLKEAQAEGKSLTQLLDPFTARTVVLTEAQVQKVHDALLNTFSPYDSSFIALADALGIR